MGRAAAIVFSFAVTATCALAAAEPVGCLVVRSFLVAQAGGKKTTVRIPRMGIGGDDALWMYFALRFPERPGHYRWIHYSQIQAIRITYAPPPAQDRALLPQKVQRREASFPAWISNEAVASVKLRSGKTLRGYVPGRYRINCSIVGGIRAEYSARKPLPGDERMGSEWASKNGLVYVEPLEYVVVSSPLGVAADAGMLIERPPFRGTVQGWLSAALKGRHGFYEETRLTPAQASALWRKHRGKTEPWTVRQGESIAAVAAVGRYVWGRGPSGGPTVMGGSGGYYVPMAKAGVLAPFHEVTRIEFTGDTRGQMHECLERRGDKEPRARKVQIYSPWPGIRWGWSSDYLFVWQTDYGFGGLSICPARKVVFQKAGAPAAAAAKQAGEAKCR